jgi:hypothetical protein
VKAVLVVSTAPFKHDVALGSQFIQKIQNGGRRNTSVRLGEFEVQFHPELLL